MKQFLVLTLGLAFAGVASPQESPPPTRMGSGATTLSETSNLPQERIGRDDLIGISVYDSPELTRTVRVAADGTIRLPMLKERVMAAGLYPADLETAVADALSKEQILVDPIVTVSVVEYRSRPISVVGAVRQPLTFQATGIVTLLDAISRAGGFSEDAGAEILVSRPQIGPDGKTTSLVQRIPVAKLIRDADPEFNLRLEGGEDIRVPEAGRIFVVGNVKKPGAYLIKDGAESSVLKALAMSEGLEPWSGNIAYIYRTEGGAGGKNEIPIELKKVMDRKAPDVPLMANDILYITDAKGRRASLKTLETTVMIAAGLGGALIYTMVR